MSQASLLELIYGNMSYHPTKHLFLDYGVYQFSSHNSGQS